MIDKRDISHWSQKRKAAWVRRALRRSRHYAPALERMQAKWRNEFVSMNCRAGGGYIEADIFDSEMVVDAHLNRQELHDLWVIAAGLEHYYSLIFQQGKLPMDHGK